jgi:acetyl esterase/lipase
MLLPIGHRMRISRSTLTLAVLTCSIAARSVSAGEADGRTETFTVHENLRFSKTDRELRLDLFVPAAGGETVACIIVIQGGGFLAKDGQKFRPFAVYLAKNGFAAALIAHRGRPDHEYRDTIADTKAAVRYVRKVSSRYNIAANRIGATGGSSGGTLAALLAVTGDVDELEGRSGSPGFSSQIQAAVTFAGVFDFVGRFSDERQIAMQPRMEAKIVSNGEWIGPPFSPENEHWLAASAVNHVDAMDPPILLMHCKDDSTVPWLQSRDMYAKMKAAGILSEIKLYETGGHGFGSQGKERKAEIVRFFNRTLQTERE